MGDIIVAGIGNPYRGDDGAGWAVIEALEGKVKASIVLKKLGGDVAELLDIFGSYSKVYLADACFSLSSSGSWQRIDALRQPLPAENAQMSTHGLGISQAIALAGNLDLLPAKLIVYAIPGNDFRVRDKVSAAVFRAVDQVAEALLHEEDITRYA